jgi:tetratricopeptide (TPR) repeat protein
MVCYEKAISLEPNDISGYTHKATLLEQLGRGEEALALYDAFIAAHPADLQGYLQKAMWYISHDKNEQARPVRRWVVPSEPTTGKQVSDDDTICRRIASPKIWFSAVFGESACLLLRR